MKFQRWFPGGQVSGRRYSGVALSPTCRSGTRAAGGDRDHRPHGHDDVLPRTESRFTDEEPDRRHQTHQLHRQRNEDQKHDQGLEAAIPMPNTEPPMKTTQSPSNFQRSLRGNGSVAGVVMRPPICGSART